MGRIPDGAHVHGDGGGTLAAAAGFFAVVAAGVVAAGYVTGRVLLDVFSLHGLAYSLFLADGDGLFLPVLVRVATWALVWALVVAAVVALDWWDSLLLTTTWRTAVALAHVSMVLRLTRRVAWLWGGVRVRVAEARRHAAIARTAVDFARPDVFDGVVIDMDTGVPAPREAVDPSRALPVVIGTRDEEVAS